MPPQSITAQIIKFSSVGVMNTAIDFGVLNLLVFAFGTGPNGELYAAFKAISFMAALANSYVWNARWVFKKRSETAAPLGSFVTVSALGFVLNVAVSSIVFAVIYAHADIGSVLASNIGALCGTLVVLAFNFVGYKFLVFRA